MDRRRIPAISYLAIVVCALAQSAFAADDTYRLTELRDLTNRSLAGTVQVTRINDQGEVIGTATDANGTPRPAFWHGLHPTNLYESYNHLISTVEGLNDRSELVGSGRTPDGRWQAPYIVRNGKYQVLPGVNVQDDDYDAVAINNRGEIGVLGKYLFEAITASYWFGGTLQTMPRGGTNGIADINNAGVIAGTKNLDVEGSPPGQPSYCYLWASGVYTQIDLPAGGSRCGIYGINDAGQVIGVSDKPGDGSSFIWQDGITTVINLKLPGQRIAWARDINDAGVIVGGGEDGSLATKPVIWRDGVSRDLNTLIAAGEALKRYVVLTEATGINNAGEIIAQGRDTRTGNTVHAYFLRPTRLPNINP